MDSAMRNSLGATGVMLVILGGIGLSSVILTELFKALLKGYSFIEQASFVSAFLVFLGIVLMLLTKRNGGK